MNSGLFKNLISEQLVCEATYTIEDYLALLSTMSPYIKLEQQQRYSLSLRLRKVLEKHCGESLQTYYLSALM